MQQTVVDFKERVDNAIKYFQSLQPDTEISPDTEKANLYLSSISTAAVACTYLRCKDVSVLESIAKRGYNIPIGVIKGESLSDVQVMYESATEMLNYPTNSNFIVQALNVLNGYLEFEKYQRKSITRIEDAVRKLSKK